MNSYIQDNNQIGAKLVRSKTRTMLILAQSLGVGDHVQLIIAAINNELQKLIPDYISSDGWQYYELPDGGFFITPKDHTKKSNIEIGITATLIALNKINRQTKIEIDKSKTKKSFLLLTEYISKLPTAKKILQAIDFRIESGIS